MVGGTLELTNPLNESAIAVAPLLLTVYPRDDSMVDGTIELADRLNERTTVAVAAPLVIVYPSPTSVVWIVQLFHGRASLAISSCSHYTIVVLYSIVVLAS